MRTVVVAGVLALAVATGASASWSAGTAPGATARAGANTMPAGNQPDATVDPSTLDAVEVSWPASAGPVPVTGYEVLARDADDGSPRAVGGTCTGVVSTTDCRDSAVPPGSWEYLVVPVVAGWTGPPSPPSDPVVVVDPVGVESVVLANGNGFVTASVDRLDITFTRALDASTICSAWSGTGDQVLRGIGVVVTITDNGSNDRVSVSAGACDLHVGTVETGRNYVTTTATYLGTQLLGLDSRVEWVAATNILTVRLGALGVGVPSLVEQSPATVTYLPDPALADADGVPVDPSPFTEANQRF